MQWWQWLVLGTVFLGAEMVVDAEFYLVFLGISALAVGLVGLAPHSIPFWAQWLLFSVFAVASLVFFRGRLYGLLRPHVPGRQDGVVGEVVVTEELIAPGDAGSVKMRGSVWTAENVGDESLRPGARAVVEKSTGLLLFIRARE